MIRLPDCVAIGGGAAGLGGVIEDSLPEPKGTRGLSAADRALVRTARELGREIATGKDARAIYSIGTQYHGTEEALAQLGLPPNRNSGRRDVPIRRAA